MRYWVSKHCSCPSPATLPLVKPHGFSLCKHSSSHRDNTRAALCQVFDSIFLDVPMSRVKFNVNTEYAYITNFKVLQSESPPVISLDPYR